MKRDVDDELKDLAYGPNPLVMSTPAYIPVTGVSLALPRHITRSDSIRLSSVNLPLVSQTQALASNSSTVHQSSIFHNVQF